VTCIATLTAADGFAEGLSRSSKFPVPEVPFLGMTSDFYDAVLLRAGFGGIGAANPTQASGYDRIV